jgi:hypothetical protein
VSASAERPRSPVAAVAWVLTGLFCLFTAENLWMDPWLERRSHGVISFAPAALGGTWMFVGAMLLICLLLLIFSHVLLLKDAQRPAWKRTVSGVAAVAATLMCAAWFVTTSGAIPAERLELFRRHHTVLLRWQASTTPNVKYNVYRRTAAGSDWQPLNKEPIEGTKYKDTTVQSGATYYYVARSVNAAGKESADSNLTVAAIP